MLSFGVRGMQSFPALSQMKQSNNNNNIFVSLIYESPLVMQRNLSLKLRKTMA